MNTEFLNNLGITDKTTVDAIFAEYGKDLNALKLEKQQLETQVETLNGEISNRDEQLKELKNSNKDNEELTKRIGELETENKEAKDNFAKQLVAIKKDHALERELKEKHGAKNIKAVLPFLDMENIKYDEKTNEITGLDDMVKTLKESQDTMFLFNTETKPNQNQNQNNPWFGFTPNQPDNHGGNNGGNNDPQASFSAQVAQKLNASHNFGN